MSAHRRISSRAWGLLVTVLLVAASSACGDDDPARTDDREPTASDPVTVRLLVHSAWAAPDDVFAPLRADGIDVEIVLGADAGGLANQVVLDAGDPAVDAVYGIDNAFLGRALAADVFATQDYDVSGLEAELLDDIDPALVVPVDYGDVCVNFDQSWFADRGIAPPRSVADLGRPELRSLTVVQDPNLSSPGLAFLLATVAHDPEGWPDSWQALADNDVLVVDGWTTAWTQEFTAGGGGGERPIVVSYASSPPVDVLFADPPRDDTRIGVVDDGCFRQVEYAGVLAGAAHPDAAARVVQALIGAETQAALPESMFVFPAREGVELPEVFDRLALRPSDPIVMSWSEADALRDDVLDRWTDIMLS